MIYCVEDDKGIRELTVYTLTASGFDANGFSNSDEFWSAIQNEIPELIILDIMLPGEDGLTILKKLRSDSKTIDVPVIIATAKGTEYDKIIGLDLGADDYLAKPFGMMEMVSRVKAVLRRTKPKFNNNLLVGGVEIDRLKHKVYLNGTEIILTLKEYELLRILAENIGIVFTRDRLLKSIWGADYSGETRTIDVHINTLRTKLCEAGNMIETVRGVGYRLEIN